MAAAEASQATLGKGHRCVVCAKFAKRKPHTDGLHYCGPHLPVVAGHTLGAATVTAAAASQSGVGRTSGTFGQCPLGDVLWPGLEKHYAHLHLGPVAAFFALAEARYDMPAGYHTPPPLAPMVHYGRSPAEVPLRKLVMLCQDQSAVRSKREPGTSSPLRAIAIRPDRIPLEGLPVYVRLAQDREEDPVCHCGVMLLRKLISVDTDPPLSAVIATGVVPRLVELVGSSANSQIVLEALWALTNVAAGTEEQMQSVFAAQGFPATVKQANTTTSDEVAEQAAWALGNLAGESKVYRDYSIGLGSIRTLISVIKRFPASTKTVASATWALSNHFRGKPPPSKRLVRAALPVFLRLITHHDPAVQFDAVTALALISDDTGSEGAELVLPAVPTLVSLLENPNAKVAAPAIRILGDIATGNDEQTDCLIEQGALQRFATLIADGNPTVRKLTCWTLSNITAGTVEQIQAVIDAGLVPVLLRLIESRASEPLAVKEAMWTIAHASSNGNEDQVRHVVEAGLFRCLLPRLSAGADPKVVKAVLVALKVAQRTCNSIRFDWKPLFLEADGVTCLRGLSTTLGPELRRLSDELVRGVLAPDE